ncbi:hypothetical protein N402_05260 [Helicobacter pylori FD423]|nr:hypothetical protein N402_05260 [Helicobacter pylori FD423]
MILSFFFFFFQNDNERIKACGSMKQEKAQSL